MDEASDVLGSEDSEEDDLSTFEEAWEEPFQKVAEPEKEAPSEDECSEDEKDSEELSASEEDERSDVRVSGVTVGSTAQASGDITTNTKSAGVPSIYYSLVLDNDIKFKSSGTSSSSGESSGSATTSRSLIIESESAHNHSTSCSPSRSHRSSDSSSARDDFNSSAAVVTETTSISITTASSIWKAIRKINPFAEQKKTKKSRRAWYQKIRFIPLVLCLACVALCVGLAYFAYTGKLVRFLDSLLQGQQEVKLCEIVDPPEAEPVLNIEFPPPESDSSESNTGTTNTFSQIIAERIRGALTTTNGNARGSLKDFFFSLHKVPRQNSDDSFGSESATVTAQVTPYTNAGEVKCLPTITATALSQLESPSEGAKVYFGNDKITVTEENYLLFDTVVVLTLIILIKS